MLSRRELLAGGAVAHMAGGKAARDSADALQAIHDILEEIGRQHTVATLVFTLKHELPDNEVGQAYDRV